MLLRGYRKDSEGVEQLVDIINIPEFTYSGKDMGERSITATINHPSPIDFRAGDFVEFKMQSLNINPGGMDGSVFTEKFYLYTMPTVKKTARPMTHGTAFEHTITLYPAQYELSLVQMRDLGNAESANDIIYTGFDNVTFVGGAVELMRRIMFVLDEAYGKGTWTYFIADEIDETKNKSLESFTFSFSGNTVMDALLKLNDKEGINTTFFINNRTIYVGYKRPYFCRVLDDGNIDQDTATQMFNFRYGKTSHENIALNYGGLFDITKSVGSETPITKLFSYGAARNINRYYCSDRIKPGRYVNRLMLPSFDRDGKTDYILSEKGIEKFGIREGTKTFDDIYPSLRYITYGDLRQVQYCIKLQASGIENEDINNPHYPIARVQCYKVVPSDKNIGVNALVPCAPPEDLTVYIHATGIVVKVVLCGGENALNRQLEKDFNYVPTKTLGGKDYIPGSCFAIHDRGFDLGEVVYYNESREAWFENPDRLEELPYSEDQKDEIKMNQITYRNTPFLTDLFVFESYDQTNFSRDGYSAWGWPRLNSQYVSEGGVVAHDTLPVNEIVEVEPVVIPDTDLNINSFGERQHTFDIYIRDVGFKIDEQNDFGENVFVLTGELTASILDGNLAGQEFNISGDITDFQKNCVCAFNDDGSINDDFFNGSDYNEGRQIAERAFANGAIWRLRLLRSNLEEYGLSGLNIALPTEKINAKRGDHLVLLNLYMPDIYVHAAENRLLREAEKFLDANDNGSISYSVNFDKVRMQQIPNYALQIREGLNVRMQDSDLAITTENDVKTIFDGELISDTSLYKTTYTSTDVTKEYYTYQHRDYYDIEDSLDKRRVVIGGKEEEYITGVIKLHCKPNFDPNNKIGVDLSYTCEMETGAGRLISDDASNPNFDVVALDNKMKFRVMNREFITRGNNSFYHYVPSDNTIELTVKNLRHKEASIDFYATLIWGSFVQSLPLKVYPDPNNPEEFDVYVVAEYDLQETHEYGSTEFTPNTRLLEYGREIYCPSKILIDFKPKKHYEIIIELFELDLIVPNAHGYPIIALLNNLGSDSIYYQPTYEVVDIKHLDNSVVFKFDFDTIEGFNDSHSYYPAVLYKSNNVIEKIRTKLLSVIESDVKGTEDLDYADFILDTVNIHVYDSNPSVQPVKEITASLSEQQDASSWASLMNRVDEAVMEGNHNSVIIENLVNSARKNYRSILALKDSIFDPDGTCDQTFLQVMMMQIGADSMNYYMLNTKHIIENNSFSNISLKKHDTSSTITFGTDVLYHYVFTNGEQRGEWKISNKSFSLDNLSVYYIALKCEADSDKGEWVCDTAQHKVDEDPDCWYFNWGILTLDSDGMYTITETRGNAYMYGDNLVCGKISNLAKNCWFDLTNGDFVLGNSKSGAAFSYIDGVLTIGGLPTDSDVSDLLIQLGILNNRLNNIGGENVLPQSMYHVQYKTGNIIKLTELMPLEAGKTYVCTYGKFEDNATVNEEWARGVCLVVSQNPSSEMIEQVVNFNQPFEANGNGRYLYIVWGAYDYVDSIKGTTPAEYVTNDFTQYLDYVMVQEGEVATSFQPSTSEILTPVVEEMNSYKYLKEALEQDTDIVGGIVATSQIHLRDWTGKWVDANGVEYDTEGAGRTKQYVYNAGLSGMLDDGVLMWGGGDYLKATQQAQGLLSEIDKLPILLTKSGESSKIGCINVVNSTQVEITGSDNTKIIIDGGYQNASIRLIKDGVTHVELTSDSIDSSGYSVKRLTNYDYGENSNIFIHTGNGPVEANLGSLTLDGDNYSIDYTDFSNIKINFGLYINSNGPEVTDLLIKFDVYLGPYLLGHCEERVDTFQLSSIYTNNSVYIPRSIDVNTVDGGDYDIAIKNAVVTCRYGGSTTNVTCRVTGVSFGSGDSSSTWKDGDITFSSVKSPILTIGNNGLQIVSANGSVNIMSDKGKAFIQAKGLPTDSDIETLDEGQFYIHDLKFKQFNEALKNLLTNGFRDTSVVSGYSQLKEQQISI